MPGRARTSAYKGVPAPMRTKRNLRRKRINAVLIQELIEDAATYDMGDIQEVVRRTSIADAMELMLGRAMQLWRVACKQADKLSEEDLWVEYEDKEGNPRVELEKWMVYEAELRVEIMEMASRMQGLNLDERKVRVQEAQMELLGRALMLAVDDVGLPEETKRALGGALRRRLADVEGTATETRPPAAIAARAGAEAA